MKLGSYVHRGGYAQAEGFIRVVSFVSTTRKADGGTKDAQEIRANQFR